MRLKQANNRIQINRQRNIERSRESDYQERSQVFHYGFLHSEFNNTTPSDDDFDVLLTRLHAQT